MTAERPIIFSGSMVRALLEGRKSQTRRIVKDAPVMHCLDVFRDGIAFFSAPGSSIYMTSKIPYAVGQHLWVRETWTEGCEIDDGEKTASEMRTYYRADGEPFGRWLDPDTGEFRDGIKWRPSIHMPRWASRITLRVTEVRVQRLHDISEEDAKAEGVTRPMILHDDDGTSFVDAFCDLWFCIHGPGSWEANPWVAAISFERIKP